MAQNDIKNKSMHDEILKCFSDLASGDVAAEDRLVQLNSGLVNGIAHRFRGRGTDFEDLVQIGNIGLIKAIRSFDISRGNAFSTYAVPLIIGEIRRFLRDDGVIKVSRVQKRTGAALMHERERYIAEHGVEPRLSEIAAAVGVTPEEAAEAIDSTSPVRSLSEIIGDDDFSLEDVIPSSDDGLSKMLDRVALDETIKNLPTLWRKIILLRYYRDYSQQQTADALGLTQVKVSREEKKIFTELRAALA